MSPRYQSIFVLVGVFVLGGVTGGSLTRFYGARRGPRGQFDGPPLVLRQRAFIEALDRDVQLEPDQRDEVRAIMREHEPEIRDIRRLVGPRVRALRAAALDEIRHVMRPDQLPRFQRFVEKHDFRGRWAEDDASPNGQDSPAPGNTGFPGRPPGR